MIPLGVRIPTWRLAFSKYYKFSILGLIEVVLLWWCLMLPPISWIRSRKRKRGRGAQMIFKRLVGWFQESFVQLERQQDSSKSITVTHPDLTWPHDLRCWVTVRESSTHKSVHFLPFIKSLGHLSFYSEATERQFFFCFVFVVLSGWIPTFSFTIQ